MSFPWVSDSGESTSDPSASISHRSDEQSLRQAMQQLFSLDDSPTVPGDDQDMPASFRANHAKFTSNVQRHAVRFSTSFFLGELLLEWLTVNCDARTYNLQGLQQHIKSSLSPHVDSRPTEAGPCVSPADDSKSLASDECIRTLLSELITEVEANCLPATLIPAPPPPFFMVTMPSPSPVAGPSHPPPPPPPMMPGFGGKQTSFLSTIAETHVHSSASPTATVSA